MSHWYRFLDRRQFVVKTASIPFVSQLFSGGVTTSNVHGAPKWAGGNIYTRFGVRPVINGLATATVLGGSIMPPEVVAAMEEAGKYFVSLPDLHEKVGKRLAGLIGVEAALVTTGAAGGITLGVAACV